MTRAILAQDSGVSVRYLAQLESGDGNISILLGAPGGAGHSHPLEKLPASGLSNPQADAPGAVLGASIANPVDRAGNLLRARLRTAPAASVLPWWACAVLVRALGRKLATRWVCRSLGLAGIINKPLGCRYQVFSLVWTGRPTVVTSAVPWRRWSKRMIVSCFLPGQYRPRPATFDQLLSSCFTVWLKATPVDHMARVIAPRRPAADGRQPRSHAGIWAHPGGARTDVPPSDAIVNTSAGLDVDQTFAELKRCIMA